MYFAITDDKNRTIIQKRSLSYSHYNILDKKAFNYCVAIALSSNDSIIVEQRNGHDRKIAMKIADTVWNKLDSRDVRDIIQISKLKVNR